MDTTNSISDANVSSDNGASGSSVSVNSGVTPDADAWDFEPFSADQLRMLNTLIDSRDLKVRVAGGNSQVVYIEGYAAMQAANRIFGYGKWGYHLDSLEAMPYYSNTGGTFNLEPIGLMYVAIVTLTVARCQPITDVGCGFINGARPEAAEMALKGAVTDGVKRCLRAFGDQFGLSLYDKEESAELRQEIARQAKGGSGNSNSSGSNRGASQGQPTSIQSRGNTGGGGGGGQKPQTPNKLAVYANATTQPLTPTQAATPNVSNPPALIAEGLQILLLNYEAATTKEELQYATDAVITVKQKWALTPDQIKSLQAAFIGSPAYQAGIRLDLAAKTPGQGR